MDTLGLVPGHLTESALPVSWQLPYFCFPLVGPEVSSVLALRWVPSATTGVRETVTTKLCQPLGGHPNPVPTGDAAGKPVGPTAKDRQAETSGKGVARAGRALSGGPITSIVSLLACKMPNAVACLSCVRWRASARVSCVNTTLEPMPSTGHNCSRPCLTQETPLHIQTRKKACACQARGLLLTTDPSTEPGSTVHLKPVWATNPQPQPKPVCNRDAGQQAPAAATVQ